MANGYTRAAFESIPGNETNTPTLSTKVIFEPVRSAEAKINKKDLERDDENRNVDEPIAVLPDSYEPDFSGECRMYPDVAGFELKAILGPPTTTAGNGVITDPDAATIPAGATRHVWQAPYGPSGPSPLTTERILAYSDESSFFKAKGCATSKLEIDSPQSGGVGMKWEGTALHLGRIANPALTPTYEALTIAPFVRGNLSIQSWLGSTATFEDFGVGIEAPVEAVPSLGIASMFPDLMEKGEGPIRVFGSVPKRHIDPDDWDALVAATGFAIKVRWQSTVNIGATSYKYALWLECPHVQYRDGAAEALQNKRRHGATFDWAAAYNGTPGSSKWTLVNATASYA